MTELLGQKSKILFIHYFHSHFLKETLSSDLSCVKNAYRKLFKSIPLISYILINLMIYYATDWRITQYHMI